MLGDKRALLEAKEAECQALREALTYERQRSELLMQQLGTMVREGYRVVPVTPPSPPAIALPPDILTALAKIKAAGAPTAFYRHYVKNAVEQLASGRTPAEVVAALEAT